MKLQDKKQANSRTVMPIGVGIVEFDENGIIEVEDDALAEELMALVEGLHPAGEEPKKDEDPEDDKPEDEKSEQEKMREAAVANINKAKKDDLVAMAVDAELPEEEYAELKVPEMKEYLISKLPTSVS